MGLAKLGQIGSRLEIFPLNWIKECEDPICAQNPPFPHTKEQDVRGLSQRQMSLILQTDRRHVERAAGRDNLLTSERQSYEHLPVREHRFSTTYCESYSFEPGPIPSPPSPIDAVYQSGCRPPKTESDEADLLKNQLR